MVAATNGGEQIPTETIQDTVEELLEVLKQVFLIVSSVLFLGYFHYLMNLYAFFLWYWE